MKKGFVYLAAIILIATFIVHIPLARAATLTSLSDTLSTIKESTLADHTIKFVTATGVESSTDTITVTFPTGFDLGSFDVGNVDLAVGNSNNCSTATFTDKALATSAAAATWGVAQAGQVITFTAPTDAASGEITADRCVSIEIGSNATTGATGATQITNQTAAQNNSDPKITIGGTFGDSGSLAVEIVADNDVAVTATVDPSITCSFTGLTTDFSSITTGSVATADTDTTITVSSNASSGVNVSVRDQGDGNNPGLYKSSGTTYLIGSADSSYNNTVTLAAGSDGFGLTASSSGGTGAALTVDGRFDASGGANEVGGLEVGASNAVSIASSTGALASRALTVTYKAAASGLAPAGSYADTVTYVCTGIF